MSAEFKIDGLDDLIKSVENMRENASNLKSIEVPEDASEEEIQQIILKKLMGE